MVRGIKRSYSLLLIIALVTNLLFSSTVIAEANEDNKNVTGTEIGGIISSDTTLILEESPYILTQDIQIAYGVTLSIEPGVIIKGNNNNLKTWGTLNAIGTNENKITFENVNIGINGKSSEPAFFDIQYANIYGGSIVKAGGNAEYGSFRLRDSYIKDTSNYMYIWYPTSDVFIERNVFENSGGISVGTSSGVNVFIRNNVFYNQKGNFAVQNWASYDSSQIIVEYNSFLSNDKIALKIRPGYSGSNMVATNNYWNTSDEKIVDSMIFDKNDDLSCASIIEKGNILLEPHENTPKVDFSELILAVTEPENGEQYFGTDEDIILRFNNNIQADEAFNEITVKDNSGNSVEILKQIEGNTLVIKPKVDLELNTEYLVEVPMMSLSDFHRIIW